MSILTEETGVTSGDYVFVVTISSGTAKLQIAVDAKPFQDITDASWTANADGVITLPSGRVKPVLTGDAVMSLSPLPK